MTNNTADDVIVFSGKISRGLKPINLSELAEEMKKEVEFDRYQELEPRFCGATLTAFLSKIREAMK